MALDRIRPLKIESPSSGGTQEDAFPTDVNHNEDYADLRGMVFQDDASDDELVGSSRDASGNLIFWDNVVEGIKTLSDVIAGAGGLTIAGHKILRQLIHFIDDGPAEGFASGAYRETTGTIFPTAIIWWESGGKTKKIVEKLITWTGVNPTTVEWKVYDTDGTTVLATVTDTISYSGVFETSRTRAIA